MEEEKKVDGEVETTTLDESEIEDYPETPAETENSEEDDDKSEPDGATETEAEVEETPEVPVVEQKFYFNGRMLTSEELFQESTKLQTEFTQRSQRLAELEKSKVPEEDLLADYDKEQVNEFQKLAKALGFVKKEDLEKQHQEQTQKSTLDTFLSKHPEYKEPAKSADLFEKLEGYNTSLKYLGASLEKAHRELSPDSKVDTSLDKSKAKVNETKINRSSSGVSSGGKKDTKENLYTPQQISVMKKMGVYEE
jgi:hypothetical protein